MGQHMILIRGIKGKQYAEKIKNGKVSCRDLLSTITETPYTGYKCSDYYEKYVVQTVCQNNFLRKRNTKAEYKVQMILDDYVPYMYMTYFHILNEHSDKWVIENYKEDDDIHFIYYIPKLDAETGTLIGDDTYFGRKIEYVNALSNDVDKQNEYVHLGLITLIDGATPDSTGLSSGLVKQYNRMMYPLFHRVEKEKYDSSENEFRIIYVKLPKLFNRKWINEPLREIKLHIDGLSYSENIRTLGGDVRDMFLHTNCPLMVQQNTTLYEVAENNKEIVVDSEFVDIDVSSMASEYGYIGGIKECLKFIEEKKNSRYFNYNDTVTKIIHRTSEEYNHLYGEPKCIIRPAMTYTHYEN